MPFAALFLRLRSIWPVMLLHAAFEFGGVLEQIAVGGTWPPVTITTTNQEALVNLLLALPR